MQESALASVTMLPKRPQKVSNPSNACHPVAQYPTRPKASTFMIISQTKVMTMTHSTTFPPGNTLSTSECPSHTCVERLKG